MVKTATGKRKNATKRVTKKPSTTTKRVITKNNAKSVAVQRPFMEFRITDQTLYWLLFGAAAIIFALWLYSLDSKVRDLYDQIDANTYNSDSSLYIKKSSQE